MSLQRVLVYGGCGALGSTCVKFFKNKSWWVGSIDTKANDEADKNFIVNVADPWLEQEATLSSAISSALGNNKFDAIICVAGGWAGGNAASEDFLKNSDLMWKQSVWSSCIAASLSNKFLKEGGFLTLTGANAALKGTPGMIGYGMAKAAVHHLTKSLASENSGLPDKAQVVSILPVTLDTPMNRKWMPKADTSTWTPLEFIAELLYKWITVPGERPPNGSLASLITKDNQSKYVVE
ncbi:dihydropteridine reductase [Halyomorpha halys]|uniref:dihydropteridine reductase n=1 Tax=Halyomorpha halys TaxID=286706 RepID=UPI0006D52068|nr:dihydropteridine reductase-like [Halyomorpha halys]